MAAISPTVGDVTPIGNSNTTSVVQIGEAVTQLQPLYQKTSDSKYYRASNDVDDEKATVAGVAITKGDSADDYVIMMTAGNVDPGATVVVATEYVLGTSEGDIAPKADLSTGNRYVRIGYGKAANDLVIDLANSGVTAP